MDLQPWVILAHILGAFAFAAGHGTSMLMAFRLRTERDLGKIAGMLDLSAAGLNWITWSGLLLLASGVVAGFLGEYWGQAWIWVSLALLLAISGLMTPFGGMHYAKVRQAIGMPNPRAKDPAPPEPASPAELDALLTSSRPWILLAMGGGGFALIVLLMYFKPF